MLNDNLYSATHLSSNTKLSGIIITHRYVLITLLSYTLIYASVAYSGILSEAQNLWWTDITWTIISFTAAVKSFHTASLLEAGREKIAWFYFGTAAFSWFIGMLIWDYHELFLDITSPYPSPADYFYMLLAPLFAAGVYHYRDETHERYITYIQIGNLGLIASASLIITIIVQYELILQSHENMLFISFTIAYAVVYIAAFLFTVYCYWFYVWRNKRNVFFILLLAIATHCVIDVLYTSALLGKSYGVENHLNVFWIIAFAFQIFAAYEQDTLKFRHFTCNNTDLEFKSRQFEGIAPSIALLLILITLVTFHNKLSEHLLPYLAGIGLMFVIFLAIREWWLSRALNEAAANLKNQVLERTHKLSDANVQLESYSYSIAHDLRAPLRSVISFSQILKEDAQEKLNNSEREVLDKITHAGKRMAELIDDILELSRVSRGELIKRMINVSALAGEVLQHVREHHSYFHGTFTIQPDMSAETDPRLIKVMLDNLYSNALKFTLNTRDAQIHFGNQYIKNQLVYFIRDNGAGFDMRYVDKLFKPFSRLHQTQEYEGTGIGLAIAQRIIQQHNGKIWVESQENHGTTFYFTLGPR